MLILAAASWFSALQLLVIGRVCWYCLAVHASAIVLAMILFWNIPHDWRPAADRRLGSGGSGAGHDFVARAGGPGRNGRADGRSIAGQSTRPRLEITTIEPAAASGVEVQPEATSGAKPEPIALEKFPIDLSDSFPPPPAGSPAAEALSRRINLLSGQGPG